MRRSRVVFSFVGAALIGGLVTPAVATGAPPLTRPPGTPTTVSPLRPGIPAPSPAPTSGVPVLLPGATPAAPAVSPPATDGALAPDAQPSSPSEIASCTTPVVGTYQAERARLASASVSHQYPGYEGGGYAASDAVDGGSVTFTVVVTKDSFYTLSLRYGNGSGAPATRTLVLDGASLPQPLTFQNFHLWSNWTTENVSVHLTPGSHTVAVAFNTGNQGPVDLDALSVIACTSSAQRSATSLTFNNWNDLVGIAQSAKTAPNDNLSFGPSLAELHYKGDWATNQIQGEAPYFSGLSTAPGSYVPNWDSNLAFDAGGVLHQDFLDQNGVAQPVQIAKTYVAVPDEPFVIVQYTLTNLTAQARSFNFMDNVELANKNVTANSQPGSKAGTQTAVWDGAHNGFDVDMTGTGQFYLSTGSFQPVSSHGAGSYIDGPETPGDAFQDVVTQFQSNGTLANDASYTGNLVSVAVTKNVALAPNATTTLSFALTVRSTAADASGAIATALSKPASTWATAERSAYAKWLASGRHGTQADQGVNNAFDVTLVTLKQSQQPQYGSWLASTNPAYAYKVWPRDASVTAQSMDAAGHTAEAGLYYHWMASVQNTTSPPNSGLSPGTWFTNYSYWSPDTPIPFVQPELDSTGLFIVGVYKHYQAVAATDPVAAQAFITSPDILAAVKLGAQFITSGIDPTLGFGPQDFSIWEERYEFATFTQATYTAGLSAAASIATLTGDAADASTWSAASATIKAAILRPADTPGKPGMWYVPGKAGNPPAGCIVTGTFHGPNCNGPYPSTGDTAPYFLRGIFDNGGETPGNNPAISLDTEVDASTGLLWVLGIVAPTDPKAVAQQAKILRFDGKGAYGIARHENDDFYFSSVYSPGGQYEANAPDPVWPQMVMYMSILDTFQHDPTLAAARLQYYASVTPYGYEPPGEAVDWTNLQPLISTASEPVTGGWFLLATLVAQGAYNPRL